MDFSRLKKILAWPFTHPAKTSSLIFKVSVTSLVIVGAAALYFVNSWDSLDHFVMAMDHTNVFLGDFVRHFYPMGKLIFATHFPYHGYFYPPFFAIFLAIFGIFPAKTAVWLWGVCQLAAIALLVIIPGRHFLRKSLGSFYLYLLLVITSVPVLHNLKWGQVSVPLVLFVLTSLFLYRKRHSLWAGLLLSFSTAVKYFTGIFLLYPLFKKDLRYAVAFVASSIIFWVVIPILFLGYNDSLNFYRIIADWIIESGDWLPGDLNSQYFVHVVNRLLENNSAASILAIVGYVVVAFNVFLVYRIARKKIKHDSVWAYVLLFASLPFILRTSWPHYFAYLPFCQIFVGTSLFGDNGSKLIHARLKAIFLLVPSAILSNIILFNIIDDRLAYAGWGCLFFANLLLLILIYLQILPVVLSRRPLPKPD